MQFMDGDTEKLNDDIMLWSIESVINQVKDMQSLVNAYFKASSKGVPVDSAETES